MKEQHPRPPLRSTWRRAGPGTRRSIFKKDLGRRRTQSCQRRPRGASPGRGEVTGGGRAPEHKDEVRGEGLNLQLQLSG